MIDFGLGNISLGPFDSRLIEKARKWRNTPTIYKWCRQSDLIKDIDQLNWYQDVVKDRTIKMYSIVHRVDSIDGSGEVMMSASEDVGICGLTSIDYLNRRAEFSLYIGPEFQRKGFARSGLKTLFRHGFENLGLHMIYGETFFGNPALDLFLEIGMKKEGVRRDFYFKGGKFIDAHLISIKKEELLP